MKAILVPDGQGGKDAYDLMFFKVDLRNENGSPLTGTLIGMNDVAEVANPDGSITAFISVYVNRKGFNAPDPNRKVL